MEVYLTFDDGIQPGTEEVLAVLNETSVRATFFLIGIQVFYAYRRNSAGCLRLLKEMYEEHTIGNHSFYHANFRYADYYQEDGVQVSADGERMPISMDFKKNREILHHYLEMIYGKDPERHDLLGRIQKKPLARLPGRNSWYLSVAGDDGVEQLYSHCETGTQRPAKALFEEGYQVYGWNVEWEMSFDFHKEAVSRIQHARKEGRLDYQEKDSVHPDFDMYAPLHLEKDRLIEGWKEVGEKVLASGTQNKSGVVLLMHDRAFRKNVGPDASSAADQLRSLILFLKERNVVFKTLDHFTRII